MKKILCIVFVIALIFSMAACGGNTVSVDETLISAENDTDELNQKQDGQEQQVNDEENINNLDWALEYINKDISVLLEEKTGGDYQEEYGQSVDYVFEDYSISFYSVDDYTLSGYSKDCEKAGLKEGMITNITLSISQDLYDDVNETMIRYPEITICGISFGMELSEADGIVKKNDDYSIEYFDNSCYSVDKVSNIFVISMLEEDVLNGKYAPKFIVEPLDPNIPVKKINVGMTKEEIIAILGTDFVEDSYIDEEYGDEYDQFIYDGVGISFLKGNEYYEGAQEILDKVSSISISTNKITGNFDFCVGDSAFDVLQFCDENYDHVINRHAVEYEPVFGVYEVGEVYDMSVVVSFVFDNYGNINSIEDVKEDTVVQEIYIYYSYM